MRTQFGNITAEDVKIGPRIIARVVQLGLGLPAYGLYYGGLLMGQGRGSGASLNWLTVLGLICLAGIFVWQITLVFKRSATIGSKSQGFCYVRTDNGEAAKSKLLLKILAQAAFEGGTCGLGAISYFVNYRDGQHWLDRAFGLVAVDSASVKPATQQFLERPQASAPRVMPVQMPHPGRPPQAVTPSTHPPAQPQPFQAPIPSPHPLSSPQQQAASIHAEGLPEPPSFQPQPGPANDQPLSANPWLLPQPEVSGSPAQPASGASSGLPVASGLSPFAPSGQAPIPAAPQPVTATPTGNPSSLLDDETIVDPSLAGHGEPVVALDDGEQIVVDTAVVIGRNPSAPPAYPSARAVRVLDESMRMSKSHLVLLPLDGGIGVYDVGATNGVYLEVDGNRSKLSAGQVHSLPKDAVLHFGGRSLRMLQ